jgi:hypothetical protein
VAGHRIRPDPIDPYLLTTPSGSVRRMARLSEPDARRWAELGRRVATSVEPRLDPRVLANRAGSAGPEPVGPSLRRARLAAGLLAVRTSVVIRTDVASFYPSVLPPTVARALAELGCDRDDVREAAAMLEGWGSEGYAGLPIGPPASAVLGNAVLTSADRALGALSWLRWVDDYLIAAPSEGAGGHALERLDQALDALGLRRHRGKTVVGGVGPAWLGASLTACAATGLGGPPACGSGP